MALDARKICGQRSEPESALRSGERIASSCRILALCESAESLGLAAELAANILTEERHRLSLASEITGSWSLLRYNWRGPMLTLGACSFAMLDLKLDRRYVFPCVLSAWITIALGCLAGCSKPANPTSFNFAACRDGISIGMSKAEVEAICGLPAVSDEKIQSAIYGNLGHDAESVGPHIFVFYDLGHVRNIRVQSGYPNTNDGRQ